MSSFFGFDPTKPPDRGHNSRAPGFGPTHNAFAGFGSIGEGGDAETFDFEDGYEQENLGAQLKETDDDFNDETFGVGKVDTNFDFSGQGMGRAQQPPMPQARSQLQPQPQLQPQSQFQSQPQGMHSLQREEPKKPARTGYESYKTQGGRMPELAPSASIWGTAAPKPEPRAQVPPEQPAAAAPSRKMMSVDEVEAMMARSAPKPAAPVLPPPAQVQPPASMPPIASAQQSMPGLPQAVRQPPQPQVQPPQQLPIHTRNDSSGFQGPGPNRQILQRPHHLHDRNASIPREPAAMHGRGSSFGRRPPTHPDQLMHLSEQERAEYMAQEAIRAKRNHKIQQLSRDNGLMTPQDKNFILRIQLQQLVTATGGTDERGPEAMLAEDFYYQVYSQIRGAPQGQPPAGNFAQAYLNQLSWRGGSRRYPRGGENHMRRMEQQVQRAVEAAKARPKNKQLVVEGSLGKISFSNSKTPKPLLNLKRPEGADSSKARPQDAQSDRKSVLRDIEACYASLMKMEDHERTMPPPPREESSADEIQGFMDWRQKLSGFNQELWENLKVLEPIIPGSPIPHPFIAILSHAKGKKLIPRVFRQIDDQQRVTILTMIVVQLDMLDVIRFAQPLIEQDIPKAVKDEIDLFAQAVEPSIFAYISDAALSIVIGLIGLITDRVNTQAVVQTRIGVNLLTRLISRAVLIMQSNNVEEADASQWTSTYTRLFDLLEPYLSYIFQTPVGSNDDFYVWQFLAALGIGANQEQQQRLVIGVKDRVMDSVQHAKSLPDEEGKPRLDKVNLFMHAIGLDVDLLG